MMRLLAISICLAVGLPAAGQDQDESYKRNVARADALEAIAMRYMIYLVFIFLALKISLIHAKQHFCPILRI